MLVSSFLLLAQPAITLVQGLAAQRNARLRQLVTLGIIRAVELRVRAVKERSDKHREETDVTPARRNNGEVSVLLFNKLAGGVWPVV